MNLHAHKRTLASALLSLMKPIKKSMPKRILPTLKKKRPFFLGNLVTKISTHDYKEYTKREVRQGLNTAGQHDIGAKVGAYLFQGKLHAIIVHIGGNFHDGNEEDDLHVLGGLEDIQHRAMLFVGVVLLVLCGLLLDQLVGLLDELQGLLNLLGWAVVVCGDRF